MIGRAFLDWRRLARLIGGGPTGSERSVDEIAPADRRILGQVRPYTMTGPLRIEALLKAVRYCVARGLDGAMVECGVWRGGSVLAILLQLLELGATDRDVYLYDTFEGMTEPTDKDTSAFEAPALETWRSLSGQDSRPWEELFNPELFNEDAVRELLRSTGYPAERLHFVRGPVEETLPGAAPESIALLRLDTDWYESTRHELEHLYPRLQRGGVLIIDDYGHWEGARAAVDEYFARDDVEPVLLHRIDYTGRAAVKA